MESTEQTIKETNRADRREELTERFKKKPQLRQDTEATAQAPPRETGDLIEDHVKAWLLNCTTEAKLACLLMDIYGIEDHGTKGVWQEIMDNYFDNTLLGIINNPDDYTTQEVLIAGLCVEATIWQKHN